MNGQQEIATMSFEDAGAADVLDVAGTLNRFGGDTDLFREMASIVLADAPHIFQALSTSVGAGDAQAIRMNAHSIKGLVLGCGGTRAGKAAQMLEDAGRDENLNNISEHFADFKTELQRFLDALRAYPHATLANEVR
jgi:HPt (histidine-containing phosphotransfer) domain-containing protein